jgi:hypothetical protein
MGGFLRREELVQGVYLRFHAAIHEPENRFLFQGARYAK